MKKKLFSYLMVSTLIFFTEGNSIVFAGSYPSPVQPTSPIENQETEENTNDSSEEGVNENSEEAIDNNNNETNIPEAKDGFKTRYIVIPKDLDISNNDEFRLISFNEDGDIFTETRFEDDVEEDEIGKVIILEDDVDSSITTGYKAIKVSFPINTDSSKDDFKFALGYKLTGVDDNYVFFLEEAPEEENSIQYLTEDNFAHINPNNYSDYNDFPGVNSNKKNRYFAVPVEGNNKNYSQVITNEKPITFEIGSDGSITSEEEFYLKAEVLAAEYNGHNDIFADLMIKKSDDQNWSKIFSWDEDLKNRNNRFTYNSKTSNITYPENTEIGIRTKLDGGSYRESWNSSDVASSSTDRYYYIEVHRNNSEIYNINKEGVDGQENISNILNNYIEIKDDGKTYATIGTNDIIILTEHATNDSTQDYFDLQDTVILITLESVNNTLTKPYTYKVVHDEGTTSSFDINMKSTTNNNNKERNSNIELKIINNNTDKNFNIKNIDSE